MLYWTNAAALSWALRLSWSRAKNAQTALAPSREYEARVAPLLAAFRVATAPLTLEPGSKAWRHLVTDGRC